VKADANIAGRNCPYCRFPIKEDTEVTVCPTCGSSHHEECWSDNDGCTITGCASGPTSSVQATNPEPQTRPMQTTPIPPRPAVPRPPAGGGPPRRDRARSGALFAALIAILVLGAALAFTIGRTGGHSSTATTEIVTTTGAAAPNAPKSPGEAAPDEPATTQTQARRTASAPRLQSYEGSSFSAMIPASWHQDVGEVQSGKEAESKWSNPANSSEYVRVDVHTPTHLSTREDAEPVREDLQKSAAYNEISYAPGDLSQHARSWAWVFEDEHSERVDYFFETCSNTIAVLGSTSPARFSEMSATFQRIADSFRSSCE
jgi:hypothetical protein